MNRIFLTFCVLLALHVGIQAQNPLDSLMEIGSYSDVITLATQNLEKDSSDVLSKQYLAKAAFLGNRLTLAKKYALA